MSDLPLAAANDSDGSGRLAMLTDVATAVKVLVAAFPLLEAEERRSVMDRLNAQGFCPKCQEPLSVLAASCPCSPRILM